MMQYNCSTERDGSGYVNSRVILLTIKHAYEVFRFEVIATPQMHLDYSYAYHAYLVQMVMYMQLALKFLPVILALEV